MSTIPTYQKINAFMESAKPSVYTKSNTEGLDRVRKEDGMYAYFMEAASIEYNIERYCDLRQLGGLLDSKGYGIALPKGLNWVAKNYNWIIIKTYFRFPLHTSHICRSLGSTGEGGSQGAEDQVVGEGEGRWCLQSKKKKFKLFILQSRFSRLLLAAAVHSLVWLILVVSLLFSSVACSYPSSLLSLSLPGREENWQWMKM